MKRVFIAGATGYLGRYLCAEYQRRGWYVIALVRDATKAAPISADQLVEAQATVAYTLKGSMAGVDLVVSCLGITRQTDGLDYWDVDYQANLNLLREAERAGVSQFGFIHVLRADQMQKVPMVAAKSAFVAELQESSIASTIVAPSGYFSDMGEFRDMAQSGRIWLFGDGTKQINPVHGADLAQATANAIEDGLPWLDIGGPDVFTHRELAELAFESLGMPPRITFLPDVMRRIALPLLPLVASRRVSGPARFFLSALAIDMVGDRHGTQHLKDHFENYSAVTNTSRIQRIEKKGTEHDYATYWGLCWPHLCRHLCLWLYSTSQFPVGARLRNERNRCRCGGAIHHRQSSDHDHLEYGYLNHQCVGADASRRLFGKPFESSIFRLEQHRDGIRYDLGDTCSWRRHDRQRGNGTGGRIGIKRLLSRPSNMDKPTCRRTWPRWRQ